MLLMITRDGALFAHRRGGVYSWGVEINSYLSSHARGRGDEKFNQASLLQVRRIRLTKLTSECSRSLFFLQLHSDPERSSSLLASVSVEI